MNPIAYDSNKKALAPWMKHKRIAPVTRECSKDGPYWIGFLA